MLFTFLGACANARLEFRTPLLFEQDEIAQTYVRTWDGPWVRFTVTDLRKPESLVRKELPDGTEAYPQERVYREATEFTSPVATILEEILSHRESPEGTVMRTADVCLVRFDHVSRSNLAPIIPRGGPEAKDLIQEEIYAQYDFRASLNETCKGTIQFFYAGWGSPKYGGEPPALSESEALAALVDHIQRSYAALDREHRGRRPTLVDFVLDSPTERWAPDPEEIERTSNVQPPLVALLPYMGWFGTQPLELQDYREVQVATGWILRDFLSPDVQIASTYVTEPPAVLERPRLHVEPVYIGIRSEHVAFVHLRVRLLWTNGAVLIDQPYDGACEPGRFNLCTVRRQLESISRRLSTDIGSYLDYARSSPPPPPPPAPPPGESTTEAPAQEAPAQEPPEEKAEQGAP